MKNQKGFSLVIVLILVVALVAIGFTLWKITNNQKPIVENSGDNTNQEEKELVNTEPKPEPNLSEDWLLRESLNSSIHVPDGFNILANQGEPFNFSLPDEPRGTLKYVQGQPAKVVGEPHKHFELGLLVAFNQEGLNDRGALVREFKTYSGLNVTAKSFEQVEEPMGVDFPKGAEHLKYKITKNTDYINVDYVYLGDGLVNIIDEMVKSANIK